MTPLTASLTLLASSSSERGMTDMNEEYWQLRAASRNYFDSHQITTRLTNRQKALARAGHVEPVLNEQLAIADDGRKRIGKELTRLYTQIAPPAIVKFQKETPGLGELYVSQLIGCVGDFRTFTEAWWEESSGGDEDGIGDDHDSHTLNGNSHTTSDSHSSDDSQRKTEKRVLVTGAVLTCGVRDIWSYCGHGDASRKRRKGMTQTEAFAAGSPLAKSIVHMIADFSVRFNGKEDKNGRPRAMSPYYPKYLEWKAQAALAHPKIIDQFGAEVKGSGWTPGHCHNHAIRKVGKAILKDLWRVQHDQLPVYGERTPWTARNLQPVST